MSILLFSETVYPSRRKWSFYTGNINKFANMVNAFACINVDA